MGCGETAAATILKNAGVPVSIGEVDSQSALAGGGSLLVEEEMRRRGLSLIAGRGNLDMLRNSVAAGYPVMVSVRRDGSDHIAVVTGYSDRTGKLTIANWKNGETKKITYAEFEEAWGAHLNHMAVVLPSHDPRLNSLIESTHLRRPTQPDEGFTVTDFWVHKEKVFIDAGYRYVTADTDVTLRLSYNEREEGLGRQLGGTFILRGDLGHGWTTGLRIEKLSLRGSENEWEAFETVPLAAQAELHGPGFSLRAGGERGAFQAGLAADLGRALSGLGVEVRLSRDQDGSYRVFGQVGPSL
jgi:hypothetical protein